MEYTPEHISQLGPNEIFVFGSNLQGLHGGGAARYAYEHFGAEWGVGVGMTGQCYAIPTMQGGAETIRPYVDAFIDFAQVHPQYKFLVTPIGCGIAGFTPRQIAPLFREAISVTNITLPKDFYDVILESKVYIPNCPYCGKPIRKNLPEVSWPVVGSIQSAYDHKVPWNYNWNGVCENCGHNFNIGIVHNYNDDGISRKTIIKVAQKPVPTRLRDLFISLSGVEIEQQTKEGVAKMFISTGELKFILEKLSQSPILEQIDCREDRT